MFCFPGFPHLCFCVCVPVSQLCACGFSHPVCSLCSPEAWRNQETRQLGGSRGLDLDILLKDQLQFPLYLLQRVTVHSRVSQERELQTCPWSISSDTTNDPPNHTLDHRSKYIIDVKDENKCHRGEFCSNSLSLPSWKMEVQTESKDSRVPRAGCTEPLLAGRRVAGTHQPRPGSAGWLSVPGGSIRTLTRATDFIPAAKGSGTVLWLLFQFYTQKHFFKKRL